MATQNQPQQPLEADNYQARAIAMAIAQANGLRPSTVFNGGRTFHTVINLAPPLPVKWKTETTPAELELPLQQVTINLRREYLGTGLLCGPWYFVSYQPNLGTGAGPLVPQTHYLKTHPEPFHEIWIGTKNFELRFNDRGYQEGDTLVLQEYCQGGTVHDYDPGPNGPDRETEYPAEYTGRELRARVTYVLTAENMAAIGGYGLTPGWVVLALELE